MKKKLADTFINRSSTPVHQKADQVAHMLGTDIRDSIPPALFGVISVIANALEKSTGEHHES